MQNLIFSKIIFLFLLNGPKKFVKSDSLLYLLKALDKTLMPVFQVLQYRLTVEPRFKIFLVSFSKFTEIKLSDMLTFSN